MITTDPTPLRRWGAVVTVALGIFAVVTAEQLPVGLLTSIGSDLQVTEGVAGLMVTAPGLVAALAAPVVPVLAGRLDRRWLLAGLLVVLVVAHAVAAVTSSFGVLLASRVLVGVAIGGFWGIAGGLAARLVPAATVSRATSLIFGGVAAANVLGVPLGTLVGELGDWRTAFAALGGFGLLVLVGLLALLPTLPADDPVRVRSLVAQLRNPGVRATVLATFLIVTAHFAAYTFVSPLLQGQSGIGAGAISSLLVGYGICGLLGNVAAGATVARRPRATLVVIVGLVTAVLVLFPVLGTAPAGGIALLLVWGLGFGGVSVSLQTWTLAAAPQAAESASALWVSTFNLSIAAGALVGGRILDATSMTTLLVVAAVLAVLTLPVVLAHRRAESDAPEVQVAEPVSVR